MKSNTAVVLCPMNCEYEYLVSQLEDKTEKQIGGYTFFEGRINRLPVVMIRCLLGAVNAAVCTMLAMQRYEPSCVILQGTAGAHDPTLKINDIVIGDRIVPLVNIISPKRGEGGGTDPFSWECFGVESYSRAADSTAFVQSFSSDEKLAALARTVPYPYGRVIGGTVGCGDVWNRETDLIRHYRKTKGTDCEAMEGIGVAQVCAAFGIPMLEIRVISNNELVENSRFSPEAAVNGQKFVVSLLTRMQDII